MHVFAPGSKKCKLKRETSKKIRKKYSRKDARRSLLYNVGGRETVFSDVYTTINSRLRKAMVYIQT